MAEPVKILRADDKLCVCVKPAGILSTDEPGGLPELLREQAGSTQGGYYTVHRLDRAASGLLLLAKTRRAASDLGKQVQSRSVGKEYFAVLRGVPEKAEDTLRDYLLRDKARKMTFSVPEGTAEAKEAVLDYALLGTADGLSLVRVRLHTGRTHQIRAQFASRGLPLYGDRKYGSASEPENALALWSCRLSFEHPATGQPVECFSPPDRGRYPWNLWKEETYGS